MRGIVLFRQQLLVQLGINNIVTNSGSSSFIPVNSLYDGLKSFKAYKLGGYSTLVVQTNSVLRVDNFSAEVIIPPPPLPLGTCIIIQ